MTGFPDLDEIDRELNAMGARQVYHGPSHAHATSTAVPRAQQAPPPRPMAAPPGAPPGWRPRPVPPPPQHRQEGPPQFGGGAYPEHIQQAIDESDPRSRAIFERAQQQGGYPQGHPQGYPPGYGPPPQQRYAGGNWDAAQVDQGALQASRPAYAVDPDCQPPAMQGPAPGFQPPPAPLQGPPPAAEDRRTNVRPLSTEAFQPGAPLTRSQAELVARTMESQAEMYRAMAEQCSALAALLRQQPPVDDDAPTVTEAAPVSMPSPPLQESPPHA